MRTRTALLACLAALSPSLASPQAAGTVVVTESSDAALGGLSDEVINIAECNGTVAGDSVTLQWNLALTPTQTTTHYRIYATTSSCPNTGSPPTNGFKEITAGYQALSTQAGSWTTAINVRNDLITPLALTSCSAGATIRFCVLVFDTNNDGTAQVQSTFTATGTIGLNVSAPGQPTGVSAASGDGALTVAWAAGSGTATTWEVTATPAAANAALACTGGGVPATRSCSGSSTSSCRITGLTNDACYDVTVRGFSDVNNPSPVSATASGVPRPVEDFWERYQTAGGREQGGCSAGSASALGLLLLAALAPRLKRRRP